MGQDHLDCSAPSAAMCAVLTALSAMAVLTAPALAVTEPVDADR